MNYRYVILGLAYTEINHFGRFYLKVEGYKLISDYIQ